MWKYIFLLLVAFTFVTGCRKDLKSTSWDAHEITPLIKSSMSLEDLMSSDLITKNADNSIGVVYKQSLYSANSDSTMKFRDTTFTYGTSLQKLALSDDSVVHSITLGYIARNTPGAGFILSLQGFPFTLPPFNNISSGDIPVDAGAFFQSIDVLTGFMDVSIKNTLPVDITTLDFQLKNDDANGGAIIVNGSFGSIPSGTTKTLQFPLDGKLIYSSMVGKIVTLNTAGSGAPVVIDTNDAVTATLKIKDLKAKTATAFFPDQEVFKTVQAIKIDGKSMLNEILVKEGTVKIEVFSSIRDTIFFTYEVPSATYQGVPFRSDTFVTPAPPGQTVSFLHYYPFKDYTLNLRGFGIEDDLGKELGGIPGYDPDTINTFIQRLVGSIKAKNKMVTLALGDTFYINAGLQGIVPEHAIGYLGYDTIKVGPTAVDLTIFNKYVSGTLDLEDVNVNLEVVNGFGAKLKVDAQNISSQNSKSGKNVTLSNSEINSPIIINTALDIPNGDSKVTTTDKVIALNKSNSNIKEFMEILPDKVNYQMSIQLNPDIPAPPAANYYQTVLATPPNFVYNSTGLDASLNIEIPLSMIANDLILADTVDFNLTKSEQSESFQGAQFKLITKNGFPFSTNVTIYMLDANNNKIDSLFTNGLIPAGVMSNASGEWKVSSKTVSNISFDVSKAKMDNLFNSKKLLLLANFNTAQPNPDYSKVYSDYSIDFSLTGDFDFRVKMK